MSLLGGRYKKIKLLFLGLILIYSFEILTERIDVENITVCTTNKDLVIIHKFKNEYTVYSEGDIKKTLQCMSKSLPFYKRNIFLISNNENIVDEISRRYDLNNASELKTILNPYMKVKYRVINTSNNNKYHIAFMKPPQLNLDTVKILRDENISTVFYLKDESTIQSNKFKEYLKYTKINGVEITQQEVRTISLK